MLSATLVVFLAPRVAAHRLAETPPFAPPLVLVPVAGIALTSWRPWRAALTEGVGIVLGAGLALYYGAERQLLLAGLYAFILLLIAYIDLDYRLVLNRLSYPGIAIAFAGSAFWPGIGLQGAALGALVGLVVFGVLQVVGRGALGTGDTKLAICIGAMRGVNGVLDSLLIGVLLGGVAAAILLLVLRRGRHDFFAYAPYLCAGAVISFFLGTS